MAREAATAAAARAGTAVALAGTAVARAVARATARAAEATAEAARAAARAAAATEVVATAAEATAEAARAAAGSARAATLATAEAAGEAALGREAWRRRDVSGRLGSLYSHVRGAVSTARLAFWRRLLPEGVCGVDTGRRQARLDAARRGPDRHDGVDRRLCHSLRRA